MTTSQREINESLDVERTDFYSFTMYYLLKSLLVYFLFFVLQALRLRNEVFVVSPTTPVVEVQLVPRVRHLPRRIESSYVSSSHPLEEGPD